MSTTFHNPNEVNLPPTGVRGRPSLAEGESGNGNFIGSQPVSRSRLRGGSSRCEYSKALEDDLIAAGQRGDQLAFVELCARHSTVTKKKILSIVRNEEDAEDALQETLLRAFTHLTSFRRDCKFSSWLIAIGVNSALMIMRKRKARRETSPSTGSMNPGTVELQEPVDRSPGPEGTYLKQQVLLHVRREVEKLQPSLRSIVSHYYGSECSLEEAAKAHDISLAAAKSRLMRGRVRLRSSLAIYGISKSRN